MLPGHHGTLGLRMSRVLVRMRRNDSSSEPSRMRPERCPAGSRKSSPPKVSSMPASTFTRAGYLARGVGSDDVAGVRVARGRRTRREAREDLGEHRDLLRAQVVEESL